MPSKEGSDANERPTIAAAPLALAVLAGILIGSAGLASLAREATAGFWNRFIERMTGRSLTINTSVPAVVNKIQQLNRLESIVYTMDKVVEGDRQSLVLPDFLAGDRLILVAHGEVIAGVDLGHIGPESVLINGRQLRVHLPAAQIFVTRLDNANSRVYSRNTGLFVAADPNLETEVRQKAEEQIRQAALADGILEKAKTNAALTMRSMLQNFGFEKVDVD